MSKGSGNTRSATLAKSVSSADFYTLSGKEQFARYDAAIDNFKQYYQSDGSIDKKRVAEALDKVGVPNDKDHVNSAISRAKNVYGLGKTETTKTTSNTTSETKSATPSTQKASGSTTKQETKISDIYKRDSSWDRVVYSRSNGNVGSVSSRPSAIGEFKQSFIDKINPVEGTQKVGGINVKVEKRTWDKRVNDRPVKGEAYLVTQIGDKKIVTTTEGGGYYWDNAIKVDGWSYMGRVTKRGAKGW